MSDRREHERGVVFESQMDEATRRAYRQGLALAGAIEMPFDALLRAEDDGSAEEAGHAEFAQRRAGVRAFLRFLVQGGVRDPLLLMKRLYAVGRALGCEPFCELTYTQAGLMFGETKAAQSFRMKWLNREIESAGLGKVKLPGQKRDTPAYREAQKGNGNRRGTGKKGRKRPTANGQYPASNGK